MADTGDKTHLWEVEHEYYCNEGNYYASGRDQPTSRYRTFSAFLEAEGNSDFDMNLLFRWDWRESEDWGHGSEFNGDENYRNGVLLLFWMGQRKGLYRWTEIEVCRADEPAVIEFLQPRLDYLAGLWQPLSAPTRHPRTTSHDN